MEIVPALAGSPCASTASPPDALELDALETRWHNAADVWDAAELIEASLAVRSLIPLVRGRRAHETPAQYASAWDDLAELLSASASDSGTDATRIIDAVNQRERLGQATPLTASIYRKFSHPNLIVVLRTDWLASHLAKSLDEQYPIQGVYGGASTFGTGRMHGKSRLEAIPSSAVGRLTVRLDGTVNASTTAYSEGVRVSSRATTSLAGDKPFTLDARGLVPRPAEASAMTNIVYTDIAARGLRRRRKEAVRRTYARRPMAEAESAAAARHSVTSRLDAEGQKLADAFNRWYFARFRDPIIYANLPTPEIRVKTSGGALTWEAILVGFNSIPDHDPTQDFDGHSDVFVCCAASALESLVTTAFSGRRMTANELIQVIDEALGESPRRSIPVKILTLRFQNVPALPNWSMVRSAPDSISNRSNQAT